MLQKSSDKYNIGLIILIFLKLINVMCFRSPKKKKIRRSLFSNEEWIDYIPTEDVREIPTFKVQQTGLSISTENFEIYDFFVYIKGMDQNQKP